MIEPFYAAYYAENHREDFAQLFTADLDSAQKVWGDMASPFAFRNVLVGSPEQCGEIWHAWISSGQIELQDEKSLYLLKQEQELNGQQIRRLAVFAAISLNRKHLYVHENVFAEGVERARQHAEACEGDMSPIFVGYEEHLGIGLKEIAESLCGGVPILDFHEERGTRHRVWKVSDPNSIQDIQKLFSEQPLYLLDGHHRLAAAQENHRLALGDGKILVCLTSFSPNDTIILPIHRALFGEKWLILENLLADIVRSGCSVEECGDFHPEKLQGWLQELSHDGFKCLLLHSHAKKMYKVALPAVHGLPDSLNHLAVSRLDDGFLSKHEDCSYVPVPDVSLALEQLAIGQAQAVFFLPPALPEQVRAVAEAHLKMPKKSTRFVPKPALGLVCRPWQSMG